jgi:hypothetical protein
MNRRSTSESLPEENPQFRRAWAEPPPPPPPSSRRAPPARTTAPALASKLEGVYRGRRLLGHRPSGRLTHSAGKLAILPEIGPLAPKSRLYSGYQPLEDPNGARS